MLVISGFKRQKAEMGVVKSTAGGCRRGTRARCRGTRRTVSPPALPEGGPALDIFTLATSQDAANLETSGSKEVMWLAYSPCFIALMPSHWCGWAYDFAF
jgi:hypothetical protein